MGGVQLQKEIKNLRLLERRIVYDDFPEKYTEANMLPASYPAPLTSGFEISAVEELTVGSSLYSGETTSSA